MNYIEKHGNCIGICIVLWVTCKVAFFEVPI